MILGMSTASFTLVHVTLSLIAMAAGFIVIGGMIRARSHPAWNGVFLATMAFTSLTGFLFPFKGVTPGIVVGILTMAVLIVAVRCTVFPPPGRRMAGNVCRRRRAGSLLQFCCSRRAVL